MWKEKIILTESKDLLRNDPCIQKGFPVFAVDSLAVLQHSEQPLAIEEAGSGCRYMLYHKAVEGDGQNEKIKIVEASDLF